MTDSSPMTQEKIRSFLGELKKRKPDTKLRLLIVLAQMDDGWHLLSEIDGSATKKGVKIPHIWENMIELSRMSGFIESDFAEKRLPRRSSFRIKEAGLQLVREVLQTLDCE